MKFKKYINIQNIFLFILFGILILTRFLYVKDFFCFGIDEEYQALLGWSIVKNFHILWIGVSASNIGYYLGPGLVYLSAFLLWLNKDPIIFGYFASFIGVITALSLFYIVKQLYNCQLALISLILYTFSPFAFYYDRKYWPLAVPLIALWLFYSLVKSLKNSHWLFLTSLFIGLSYHLHMSLWLFWPIIFFFFLHLLFKRKISWLTVLSSIIIFMVVTLPQLIFDFLHNFDNLKLPFRLLKFGQSQNSFDLFSRLFSFITYFSKIFISSSNSLVSLFLFCVFCLFLVILARQSITKKKQFNNLTISNLVLISLFCLFFLGFVFFPSPVQEYYFVLLLPFAIILFSLLLNKLSLIGILAIFIFIIVNLYGFLYLPKHSDYQERVNITKQAKNIVKNNSFYLEVEGNYLFNGGWKYLFQAYGLNPSQSSADSIFGWIYPDEISSQKPKYKVIISKNNNLDLKSSLIKKFTSGIYTTYILNNK